MEDFDKLTGLVLRLSTKQCEMKRAMQTLEMSVLWLLEDAEDPVCSSGEGYYSHHETLATFNR